jgi:isocitrate dehydrogenase (NAD+)
MFKQALQKSLRVGTQNVNRSLTTRVTMIPGDGIGPEVMEATKDVISAVQAPIEFDEHRVSEIHGYRERDLEDCLNSIRQNKVVLQGFILASTKQKTKLNLAMQIRRDLDIFANVSHVKSYDGVDTRYKNLDFIIFRETTEGEYCGEEHESVPGVVESLKLTTQKKCERVARFAFDYALRHNRSKVTCVHKANIMKKGDGLFRSVCTEVSKMYPSIEFQDMIVDNTCMQLVSNPYQFDVMVTPNLYGNIIENLGAGLIGGTGLHPGAFYSEDVAMFGAGARYSFQSGAGKDIANPTAIFMSCGNMLAHLGLNLHGNSIKEAVRKTLKKGKVRTRDIGGKSTLTDFTNDVISNIKPVAKTARARQY